MNDSTMSALAKMAEGNMGAMEALIAILENKNIDPENVMNGIGPILLLDTIGIYGSDIYVLHSDICRKELSKTLAVLRACQLGMFSSTILKEACSRQDYSGRELVPVEELYLQVREKLVSFDLGNEDKTN